VWVSMWYFKLCFLIDWNLQFGYSHLNVSPVWISLCAFNWLLWAVENPQTSHKC
jgi:hypothetical protein